MRRIFCKQLTLLVLLGAMLCAKAFAETDANVGATLYMYSATIESSGMMQSGNGSILDKNRIRIINLGPVNSKGDDYAPTISADGRTLFFVSNRSGSKLSKDGKSSHDFWAARKNDRLDTIFAVPYNIDTVIHQGNQGVNTPLGEGAASIAADKQSLFFTGCNREDGLGSCDIYRTTIEGDQWGRPVNLGPNVNSKYFDSQPSIAPDQSRIYFVSTRPGPNSDGENRPKNFDIWYSDWDDDAEEWRPAQNLSQLNTTGQDVSPFIAADNSTLFFASDGHKPNFGKLDFYVSRFESERNHWTKPENLGEPINTDEDEMFISLPASGDIIYFSSKREDLKGYQGNLDLFMAFVPTFFRAVNVVGTVVDECSGEFIPAAVTIRNPITGRVVHDSLTTSHTDFEFVVSNTDYGNPKDSIKFVDLEITAENVKYAKKSVVQRILRPSKTEDPDEAKKFADEVKVKFTLGQRPQIATDIAEADYVRRYKAKRTEIAGFNGLVMEQVATWDLYPLLNYVFFDAGSSTIPKRYNLFKDPSQTAMFTDTTIAGGTLNKYYHLLNIYGFRLTRFPASKIEIVGTNDGTTPEEKRAGLSKERAENIYNYFKNIWKIDESRMKLTFRDKPAVVSNLKDSLGIVENRRVEILCDDWNVMQPVFDKDPKTFPQPDQMTFKLTNGIEDAIIDKRRVEIKHGTDNWITLDNIGTRDGSITWDWTNADAIYPKDELPYTAQLIVTTKSGAECRSDIISIPVMQVSTAQKKVIVGSDSTLENYSLILFPFDRSDAGEINERIMREYVYERSKPTSAIWVTGHTDVVGLYDHNKKLSERRATTVENGIKRQTGGKVGFINVRGVGEDEPLYDNALPEGRFYNRTVNVIIRTPVEEYQEK
ncbi:MAG: OmpA family protein [Chloroflexota bacterium]